MGFNSGLKGLISSSIELSVFTIVPKYEYLNEFTCSDCSSPVFMYVEWIVFLGIRSYEVQLRHISTQFILLQPTCYVMHQQFNLLPTEFYI